MNEERQTAADSYRVEGGPNTVNMELTLRCNLKCKMCERSADNYKLPPNTDMAMATVSNVLPLLKISRLVWLSGFGEPLLHPDLVPIIKMIRRENPTIEIAFTTNFLLVKGDTMRRLIEAGLSRIQVSVDGDNEMGHAFSPTPEGVARYQEVLWERLADFHAMKKEMGTSSPLLQFCFVAMRRNIEQLEALLERGHEVGLSSIVVQPVRDYHGTLHGEDIYENRDVTLPILIRARETAEQRGIEFISRFMDDKLNVTRQKCTFPSTFFHVAVDGNVFMCCAGISACQNAATSNALEIWNSTPYRELRRELDTGKLRKKCWECPLIKPTTDNEDVLRIEMEKLDSITLTKELITHMRYMEAAHEREKALQETTDSERKRLTEEISKRDSLLARAKVLLEKTRVVQ